MDALILVWAGMFLRLLSPRWKRCFGNVRLFHVLLGQKIVPPC